MKIEHVAMYVNDLEGASVKKLQIEKKVGDYILYRNGYNHR